MNSSVLKIAAVETPALSVNPYSQGRLQSLAIRTKGASPHPEVVSPSPRISPELPPRRWTLSGIVAADDAPDDSDEGLE